MDMTIFNEAQKAYAAGDYARAIKGFDVCSLNMGDITPEETCKFYHLLGNCHMKSGSPAQAAHYYSQALKSAPQDHIAPLQVNLGKALLSSKEYEEAANAFSRALDHSDYATPYKAYSGLGAAQLKVGDLTAAGAAYREAALDPANPNPGKSLVNLGVCFMALGRAEDALVSYDAALDMGLSTKFANKTHANMGSAYAALGEYDKAIEAFEAAMEDGTYTLDAKARQDLEAARDVKYAQKAAALRKSYAEQEDTEKSLEDAPMPEDIPQPERVPLSSAVTQAFPVVNSPVSMPAPVAENETEDPESDLGEDAPLPSPEVTGFFDFDEEAALKEEKEERRKIRRSKGTGLKVILAIVIILIIVAGAAVLAYMRGFGYPTQETVAEDFFAAVQSGSGKTDKYWSSSVDQTERDAEMAPLSGIKSYKVTSVQRSTSDSVVFVSATLDEGADVYYRLVMERDKLGWDINYVELYFPSCK